MDREHSPPAFQHVPDWTGAYQNSVSTSERRHSWLHRRTSSNTISSRRKSSERRRSIARAPEGRKWWMFTLRPWDDDSDQDWWFAGTAVPLLAATISPLANLLSIAALVTSWRMCLVDGVDPALCPWDGGTLNDDIDGHPFTDPQWCYALNIVSLIMGFVGNLFLLFNFTNRVRYIIALPLTIILWYAATGILIGIEVSMNVYVPPVRPQQTYTQGFWYAVIAAVLYLVCSMLLMVNMLGYFLGHYPQQFNLTDSQRTLILQTMLFFIWLGGGAGVFSVVESKYGKGLFNWSYVNSLYYCNITITTIGFGDCSSAQGTDAMSRIQGLLEFKGIDVLKGTWQIQQCRLMATYILLIGDVFPYAVGGIIMLGLVISSITKFATELGENKVLQKHVERSRSRTISRAITDPIELKERDQTAEEPRAERLRPTISGPFNPVNRSIAFADESVQQKIDQVSEGPIIHALRQTATIPLNAFRPARKPRLVVLREEKDRFDAMRRIQHNTAQWKKWSGLIISVTAFAILWCIGALVFWKAEQRAQGITYFQSLYLCYISLLTIGYGDLAPKSNAGRPFFLVWSLVAVPTMTILIADMGDTVISGFKQGTFRIADFTILPKAGIWQALLPRLSPWLRRRRERKAARQRLERGFETGTPSPTIDGLAKEDGDTTLSDVQLARKLASAIRRAAKDLQADPPRSYTYEEWVQFTRLIRFTAHEGNEGGNRDESDGDGLIEWDWIGEDSPMMAQQSEAEFVLDRLCESMGRYLRGIARQEDEGKEDVMERRRDDGEDSVDEVGDGIAEA